LHHSKPAAEFLRESGRDVEKHQAGYIDHRRATCAFAEHIEGAYENAAIYASPLGQRPAHCIGSQVELNELQLHLITSPDPANYMSVSKSTRGLSVPFP
jgi:hypothetical protein